MAAPFSLMQQLPGKSDLWLQLRGSEAARTALSILQAHHTHLVDRSKQRGPLPPRRFPKSPYGSLPSPEPTHPGVLDCCPPQWAPSEGTQADCAAFPSAPLARQSLLHVVGHGIGSRAEHSIAVAATECNVVLSHAPLLHHVRGDPPQMGPSLPPPVSPGSKPAYHTVHNPYSFDGPQYVVQATS
eukprot:EG_transcript_27631